MAPLDTRTIMVMISLWMLLLSGLFTLIGVHVKTIRGTKRWAIANLCFGLGFSMAYFQVTPGDTPVLAVASALLALAICLQYLGLQEFSGQKLNRIILLAPVLVFLQTSFFIFLFPHVNLRTIANTTVLFLLNVLCARLLLVRVRGALGVAYGLTGASFLVLCLMLALRIGNIVLYQDVEYRIYAAPVAFALGGILELCITLGFMLMIFYRLRNELHELAIRDSLTGAYNRGNLDEEAVRIISLCERARAPLAVMMIDMDHFKSINDRHGHVAGDLVLKHLADVVRSTIRAHDCFVRYGGEEFCILLPATNGEQARMLAERLRSRVEESRVAVDTGLVSCTVSIGLADAAHDSLDVAALISRADQALYRAKQAGRNRVVADGDAQQGA